MFFQNLRITLKDIREGNYKKFGFLLSPMVCWQQILFFDFFECMQICQSLHKHFFCASSDMQCSRVAEGISIKGNFSFTLKFRILPSFRIKCFLTETFSCFSFSLATLSMHHELSMLCGLAPLYMDWTFSSIVKRIRLF